jgi:hypothetical protein
MTSYMTRTKQLVATAVLGLATLASALGGNEALALDTKIYPGSSCIPANEIFMTEPWDAFRGTFTVLGATTVVECPIIRDGKSISKGFVRVVDRRGDLSCTLVSRRTDVSNDQGFAVTLKSKGANALVQTLNFGTLAASSTGSMYSLSCFVPGKTTSGSSQVIAYSVEENE